jgi:predicted NodU family carbamoyl transferase
MEYGPRALCHTSTLAVPSAATAEYINTLNARTNEMPFAPVMSAEQANELLANCDKVHKSLEYMIITRDLISQSHKSLDGASHLDVDRQVLTARPQVTYDPRMLELLRVHGPLINTSFNFHGVPIVFDAEQIRHTHAMEQQRVDEDWPIRTIVIGD